MRAAISKAAISSERRRRSVSSSDGQADEAIRAVEAELALKERAANAGDVGPLKARIGANPGDLEARFQLATVLDAKGERDEAINELLEIIKRDRKWNEEAAKKQLLTLFEAMGPMDARTISATPPFVLATCSRDGVFRPCTRRAAIATGRSAGGDPCLPSHGRAAAAQDAAAAEHLRTALSRDGGSAISSTG